MTAVGGPLVVAACTEFTSLILLRFVEERAPGPQPHGGRRRGRVAAPGGRSSCRRLTAVSGVAVIATSSLPLLRDFGIVVGMNVAVALLSARRAAADARVGRRRQAPLGDPRTRAEGDPRPGGQDGRGGAGRGRLSLPRRRPTCRTAALARPFTLAPMGLQGFERRLEQLVEGTFSKAFRSGLQPVEIARKLIRELDAGRSLGVRGTVAGRTIPRW